MKKLISILLLSIVSSLSFAAGDYDGIWQAENTSVFATIHQNEDSLVFVILGADEWSALQGTLQGSQASLSKVTGSGNSIGLSVELQFESATKLTLKVLTCNSIIENACDNLEDLEVLFGRIF
ncbi:MAG: hypothetical protein COC19_05555 [SAR86 cluster bacterium]|uniref:Uncharacterized protein n=1 Tax=SAR86 cluster bacterium TaxID=2030880 RepID=A0A2A4ML20_9GAMM|nr:MAG: hypothetical protein COC19_05555 [SAR86 cluster bacterium]